MNGNRGQYSSASLYNLKNKRSAIHPQGEEAPKPEARRFRVLSIILSIVLPALFLLSLLIPNNTLRWAFLVAAGLSVLAMWVLKAFVRSARNTLTVIYLALAVVVGLALFMNSQTPEARNASLNRAAQGSLFSGEEDALAALLAASATETPAPQEDVNVVSPAQLRLEAFFEVWGKGDIPSMLEFCLPSWVGQQASPQTTLWQMLQNNRPESYMIESVEGSEGDTSRTVSVKANFGNNVLKRLRVLLLKVNGVWYVDPNTLGGVLIDEAAEAARQNQPLLSTTIAPTATPSPESGSGITVYYNADGGKYYHAVQNCPKVREEYWGTLTAFSFDLINSQKYKELMRCPGCNPPERPKVN